MPRPRGWVDRPSEGILQTYGLMYTALSEAVRQTTSLDVWVMFRVVPLAQAFLNGEPRSRGSEAFE